LKQTAASVLGFLLSCIAYGRASDLALALKLNLEKPFQTLYPQSIGKGSKMEFFDNTITIGSSHVRRKSLTHLLLALAAMNRSLDLLVDVSPAQYLKVFN
jgi:hypothetical protein